MTHPQDLALREQARLVAAGRPRPRRPARRHARAHRGAQRGAAGGRRDVPGPVAGDAGGGAAGPVARRAGDDQGHVLAAVAGLSQRDAARARPARRLGSVPAPARRRRRGRRRRQPARGRPGHDRSRLAARPGGQSLEPGPLRGRVVGRVGRRGGGADGRRRGRQRQRRVDPPARRLVRRGRPQGHLRRAALRRLHRPELDAVGAGLVRPRRRRRPPAGRGDARPPAARGRRWPAARRRGAPPVLGGRRPRGRGGVCRRAGHGRPRTGRARAAHRRARAGGGQRARARRARRGGARRRGGRPRAADARPRPLRRPAIGLAAAARRPRALGAAPRARRRVRRLRRARLADEPGAGAPDRRAAAPTARPAPRLADARNIRQAVVRQPRGHPRHLRPGRLQRRGLPIGLQLLAPWGAEARLLDAAQRVEDATGRRFVDAVPDLASVA